MPESNVAVTTDGVPVYCAHGRLAPIAELVPNPNNPNQHPQSQLSRLGEIIEAQGWRAPITVSTRSGYIVRGHGRYLAAVNKGWYDVPVDIQEYATEAEEYADLIADNRLAELAQVDDSMLCDLFNGMNESAWPMTGFEKGEIDSLMRLHEGGFIDDLYNETFSAGGVDSEKDTFEVTFSFDRQYHDEVTAYIKRQGKAELVDALLEKILGEVNEDA